MAKREPFTKEFKLEAARLWESSGGPATAVARELGLQRNHLYKWQTELETHDEAAFPGKGGHAHNTDELTRLRRENARLREERDIVKKPWPSLREARAEVCLYPRACPRALDYLDVRDAAGKPKRLLCMTPPAREPTDARESAVGEADEAAASPDQGAARGTTLDTFYDRQRLHQTLGYASQVQFKASSPFPIRSCPRNRG